ncbi:hypothetical protein SCUP234_01374 [Seiridium cupressi]
MAFNPATLPKDFLVTCFQFTRNVYRDQYPSIDPSRPELNLAGKVAIVTGASRGIGAKAFAPAFAKAGVKGLVLLATDAAKLQGVRDEIKTINPSVQVLLIQVNVADQSSVDTAFEKIKATFGRADILVNNAGICNETPRARIANEDPEKWWSNFEVNAKGPYLTTGSFIRLLPSPDAPATIINLVTGASWTIGSGAGGHGGYALSKLVTQQLTVQTAGDYPNITSVAVSPGLVDTEMVPPPLRRFGFDAPELVGGLAVWLAHPHAKFLSGRTLQAHWFVDDLVERQEEIKRGNQLRMEFVGPFGKELFQ